MIVKSIIRLVSEVGSFRVRLICEVAFIRVKTCVVLLSIIVVTWSRLVSLVRDIIAVWVLRTPAVTPIAASVHFAVIVVHTKGSTGSCHVLQIDEIHTAYLWIVLVEGVSQVAEKVLTVHLFESEPLDRVMTTGAIRANHIIRIGFAVGLHEATLGDVLVNTKTVEVDVFRGDAKTVL